MKNIYANFKLSNKQHHSIYRVNEPIFKYSPCIFITKYARAIYLFRFCLHSDQRKWDLISATLGCFGNRLK